MPPTARLGLGVWLALAAVAAAGGLPWRAIEPLFLLAPLVLVPLAIDLVGPARPPRDVRAALPLCASLAAASMCVPRGRVAGALAAAWLVFTVRLAAWGIARLVRRRADAAEAAIDLGLTALPVGASWLVASRVGLEPLGFREPIVLLTAVHFHYAAFVALVWTGCAARRLRASRWRRAAVAGVASGTPLLAAGITLDARLELLGAAVLVASLGGLAVAVLVRVCPRAPAGAAWLRASACSALFALALAFAYAWGQVFTPLLSLDTVARLHGTANALGFGLCGLVGWTRLSGAADAS